MRGRGSWSATRLQKGLRPCHAITARKHSGEGSQAEARGAGARQHHSKGTRPPRQRGNAGAGWATRGAEAESSTPCHTRFFPPLRLHVHAQVRLARFDAALTRSPEAAGDFARRAGDARPRSVFTIRLLVNHQF